MQASESTLSGERTKHTPAVPGEKSRKKLLLSVLQTPQKVEVMTKTTCDGIFLQIAPTISNVEDLQSTYIVNCVFNSFLSYTATMLNIVTIYAIRKTPSLPKPLKTLFLSLAVSDLGVGLFCEPFYIWLLVRWSRLNIPSCTAFNVFFFPVRLFAITSYLTVVAVSLERFLAIHLHLRYQEIVTHKRVIALVFSIWIISLFICSMYVYHPRIVSVISSPIAVACILATTFIYWKIYIVLRRHKEQIRALQPREVQQAVQNGNMVNFTSLRKSVVGLFYVCLAFLICYLPHFVILAARVIQGPNLTIKKSAIYSWTLIFLNSSLNPVIYCWKMRHIRHAIMDILRNITRRYRTWQE